MSQGSLTMFSKTPKVPSTYHLRTLVPKAIKGMVFGTRSLKCWVLSPKQPNPNDVNAYWGLLGPIRPYGSG